MGVAICLDYLPLFTRYLVQYITPSQLNGCYNLEPRIREAYNGEHNG